MKGVAYTLLFAALAAAQYERRAVSAAGQCKVMVGDATWPAESVWKAAMPELEVRGADKLRRRHGPGGDDDDSGAKRPDYRMEASTVDDVINAVNFANKHNVRFTILNSGHDFLGRNDAPSGLALVLTALKGVRVSDSYTATAEGVPSVNSSTKTNVLKVAPGKQAYVTFGSGMSTQLLNNELEASNLVTMGAAHGEVSVAGGWGQVAGHGPLGPRFGMGADAVVEYKVVTADGKLKVANAVSNPDLFWALRGGGGGTFGVVTEATIKAFPSPKMTLAAFFINTTEYNDHNSIYPMASYFHSLLPDAVENGFSGYYYLYPNAIKGAFVSINEHDAAYANKTWLPAINKMLNFPGISKETMIYQTQSFPNFKLWFDSTFGAIDAMAKRSTDEDDAKMQIARSVFRQNDHKAHITRRHGPGEGGDTEAAGIYPMASRLMTREALSSSKLAAALKASMPTTFLGQLRGNVVGGGVIKHLGNDTAVLPAWRKAYVHLIATTSTKDQPSAAALKSVAPDTGSYANECSRFEPGWKETFFGPNYDKLLSIKNKYDPGHFFWVTPGVGADYYTVKNGRVCAASNSTTVDQASSSDALAPVTDNENYSDFSDTSADGTGFPIIMGPNGPMKNPALASSPSNSTGDMGAGTGGPVAGGSPSAPNQSSAGGMGGMGGMGSTPTSAPAATPTTSGMGGMGGMGSTSASPTSSGMDGMSGMPPKAPGQSRPGVDLAALLQMFGNLRHGEGVSESSSDGQHARRVARGQLGQAPAA